MRVSKLFSYIEHFFSLKCGCLTPVFIIFLSLEQFKGSKKKQNAAGVPLFDMQDPDPLLFFPGRQGFSFNMFTHC